MKYIGSKAKFADEIVAILQGYISEYKIKQYVEPFRAVLTLLTKCNANTDSATILTRSFAI